MIVADLPESTRKVHYMIHEYANKFGLTFEEALEQLLAVARKLMENEVKS